MRACVRVPPCSRSPIKNAHNTPQKTNHSRNQKIGGPFFNLFNLGKTPADMKTLKLKEIKNGRLAMLACFGYGAQAVMTREGPFKNLLDHLSDPTGHNILTNFATVQGQ